MQMKGQSVEPTGYIRGFIGAFIGAIVGIELARVVVNQTAGVTDVPLISSAIFGTIAGASVLLFFVGSILVPL
jgi:hypothetical protein